MKITIEDYNGNTVLTLNYEVTPLSYEELGKLVEERDLDFNVADIDADEQGLRLQYEYETTEKKYVLLRINMLIVHLNELILKK